MSSSQVASNLQLHRPIPSARSPSPCLRRQTSTYVSWPCLCFLASSRSGSLVTSQRAIEMVQRAIDEDIKQNYAEAYKLYMNSLDYFMLAQKCQRPRSFP